MSKARKNRLIIKEKQYEGLYVALGAAKGSGVIASGKDPGKVIKEARSQGEDVPTILFVPQKGVSYLY